MANKTAVTALVLSQFQDKYTKEIRKRGSTFPTDEKRVKEINAGRNKPLVRIVDDAGENAAQNAPTTPPAQAEQNDASGENSTPAASTQTEAGATEATSDAGGKQAGEPASATDSKKPETKGKGK